jgi:flagellar L-ring protein precursor FlgH
METSMKTAIQQIITLSAVALFACLAIGPRAAEAQNSSLMGPTQQRQPLTLSESSWTYQAPEEPRTIKLHDLVTVMVDEKSVMISDAQMDRKKKAYGDLKLPDWIIFKSLFHVIPSPQTNGMPHLRGELDNKLQSQGNLESRESLKFRIACNVVDIRPNGNIVVEGRRTIKNNEDTWEYSLTGEVRPDSIKPNNTVFSEDIAEMRIVKRETGHVRDGYRRGWALEWLDKVQPF